MEGYSPVLLQDRYPAHCSGNLSRLSCFISQAEMGKRDFIAYLRLCMALLSILGTVSIVVSVIWRKQILNPKIHTIFTLSIADFLLGVMWVVGAILWLSDSTQQGKNSRVGCFAVLLITVILECVAINLTCVYALLAYSSIKKKDFSNTYSLIDKAVSSQAWKPSRIIIAYLISWILPVVLIMVPFSVVAGGFHLVREANVCSCWCLPYFGNVLPLANPRDNDTAYYMHHMSMLVGSYSVIVVGNYLVAFIILVTAYWKILRLIRKMKQLSQKIGARGLISKGQSQAKRRVVYFLTVFIFCGLFNLILSTLHIVIESFNLRGVPQPESKERWLPWYGVLLYVSQSITVPLQGFLNAIVYGWTRQEFVLAIRSASVNAQNKTDKLFREQESSHESGFLTSATEGSSIRNPRSIVVPQDLLYSIPEQ